MNKMRNIFIALLSLLILSACNSNANTENKNQTTQSSQTSSESQVESEVPSQDEDVQVSNLDQVQTESEESKESEANELAQVSSKESKAENVPVEDLAYEDFQGFYVTFEGELYNSRPESTLEILPNEIRIGWPQSEYIPFLVTGHSLSGNQLTVETHELDQMNEIISQESFDFILEEKDGTKTLTSNGVTYYEISQDDYDTLVQRASGI